MAGHAFVFGPFRLDPAGVLWRDGQPVPLGRREALLLEVLLSRRGQVVTKAELIDAGWPDQAVEENNLTVQIAHLRKRIGGDWIRTVERVGYQLLGGQSVRQGSTRPTLVIRPLRDLGDAAEAAQLLTEDLILGLTRFGSLRMLQPGAGMRTADYILEGSLRRGDGRLRIDLRLVQRVNGHYVWADRFEAPVAAALPAELITSVVEGQVELAEIVAATRDHPTSEDAPALFRRAQMHLRISLPDHYAAAAELIERALALDPDNVRYLSAMCEVVGTSISMGWVQPTGAEATRMLACAVRGLRQPEADAEALSLFGFGLFRAGDPDGGYALMRRAAELNPNSLTAVKIAGQAAMNWGTLADAERYFRDCLLLDPRHFGQPAVTGGLARIRMAEGRFEEALAWAVKSYSANLNFGGTRWTLIAANALLGRDGDARRFLDRFRIDHPGVTIERIRHGQPTRARLASTLEGLDRAGLERTG